MKFSPGLLPKTNGSAQVSLTCTESRHSAGRWRLPLLFPGGVRFWKLKLFCSLGSVLTGQPIRDPGLQPKLSGFSIRRESGRGWWWRKRKGMEGETSLGDETSTAWLRTAEDECALDIQGFAPILPEVPIDPQLCSNNRRNNRSSKFLPTHPARREHRGDARWTRI